MTVHLLDCGRALCGKPGVPGEWNDGDRWVRLAHANLADCEPCLLASGRTHVLTSAVPAVPAAPDLFKAPELRTVAEHDRAVLIELGLIPAHTLQSWVDRSFGTVMALARRELARRQAIAEAVEPECPYCVGHLCPEHQPLKPPIPGHTLCDYEGCEQAPTVTLPRGAVMCERHAAESLLMGMSSEKARSIFAFARPVPEASPTLPRTRALLRQLAVKWNATEADTRTREYVGPRFDLLRQVLDAFEAEDLEQ